MSSFENNYYAYTMKDYRLPNWAKAERYDYCEPFFSRMFSGKASKSKGTKAAK